jgi:hypothetical protein
MAQVSRREMNLPAGRHGTNEPLVEIPIVGNTVSERMSYMGLLMSVAAVNRCWQHGTRDKGGMTRLQALRCNGESHHCLREKNSRWHHHQDDYREQ